MRNRSPSRTADGVPRRLFEVTVRAATYLDALRKTFARDIEADLYFALDALEAGFLGVLGNDRIGRHAIVVRIDRLNAFLCSDRYRERDTGHEYQ